MYGLTVDSNGNISGANLDKASRFGNAIPQNDPTNTTKGLLHIHIMLHLSNIQIMRMDLSIP